MRRKKREHRHWMGVAGIVRGVRGVCGVASRGSSAGVYWADRPIAGLGPRTPMMTLSPDSNAA